MDYSRYREILNSDNELDSSDKKELLRIYLQTPSLQDLQAARALLLELKTKLNCCKHSKQQRLKKIQRVLYKNRSM